VKAAVLRDTIKGTLRIMHTASDITTEPNVKITTRLVITTAACFTILPVTMFNAARFGLTTD
jgi:hypothetical protein